MQDERDPLRWRQLLENDREGLAQLAGQHHGLLGIDLCSPNLLGQHTRFARFLAPATEASRHSRVTTVVSHAATFRTSSASARA